VQKEIEEHKEEIKKIQLENKKHENTIQNMIKDMDSLKKEIDERDETIQDKVS
jgi:predicted nuclease with TOPRIM domain